MSEQSLWKILGVEFSGPTYQVEVWDFAKKCSFWTFFQYNEEGILKDAFCSCEEEECPHLKIAFLKISDSHAKPWHIRYQDSFWTKLTKLFARKLGYSHSILQKMEEGSYEINNELYFSAKALSKQGESYLINLFVSRKKETPENSLKFSNLSEEEVQRWKQGRATPKVLYELSFWSDLSKKLFVIQEEGMTITLTFQENEDHLPCYLLVTTSDFCLQFNLRNKDLAMLVPFLKTVPSFLKLHDEEEKIESITYHPERRVFVLKQKLSANEDFEGTDGIIFGNYKYISGKGFYPISEDSLLSRDEIKEEQIANFLDLLREKKLLSKLKNCPFHEEKEPLKYSLAFDSSWNLHINAYLFKKDDTIFFGNYAYVRNRGFFSIDTPLFHPLPTFIQTSQVSQFVTRFRSWLNEIPGFVTHLSSVDIELSYFLEADKKQIRFESHSLISPAGKTAKTSHDFGDWVYFFEEGFFPKRENRLSAIPSGLEIPFEELSAFLRSYKEELFSFFLTENPFNKRGLNIWIHSFSSIFVKPEYELKKEYQKDQIYFFEEFVLIENHGFFELPHAMRLPAFFQKEVIYHQNKAVQFLEDELPGLKVFVSTLDPRLQQPKFASYVIESMNQDESGRLHLDLSLVSELGRTSCLYIHEALQKKQTLFFSQAGALSLKEEQYEWLKTFSFPEGKLELTPLQFLRLDAIFGFNSQTDDPHLRSLREFISIKSPKLKGFKSHLRPYQIQGLEWLYFLYQNLLSGLLCDDMGLGKTHQAMALMAAIMNHKKSQNKAPSSLFLVVAPTSVIYHWQDKLAEFLPKLKVHLFHGTKRNKRFPKRGVILTTYGILRVEKEQFEERSFDLAIFDEVQIAKNPHSQIHKILAGLQADMRLGLTGTPIENTLFELKALFDIVLPSYMPKEKSFKEQFVLPIEKEGDVRKRELLTRLIKPFVLRRRKKEVLQDLPEKSEDKSYCALSPQQIELYSQVLEERKQEIMNEIQDASKPPPYMHIFSLLSTLKQICNHPALYAKDPDNYKQYTSGKWDLFVELLSEAMESDQKVVVFTQYLQMLDIMKKYITERGFGFAEIRGSTRERGEEMERFRTDPNCKIFLGSLQAAGLGIDLTAASIVILYDRWWNAARENQAIDRVHRIGQKWGVQVYKLIAKETIEEKIDRMITKKGKLLEEVVTIDDQETLKTFTRKELIELLQFSL